MSSIADTIIAAHDVVKRRVFEALHTQMGDRTQLQHQQQEALQLLDHAMQVRTPSFHSVTELSSSHISRQHSHLFRPNEMEDFCISVGHMVAELDEAAFNSLDPPDIPPEEMGMASGQTGLGGRGRPKLEIDCEFLAHALEITSVTAVARVLKCHPRTVRRRALAAGIVQPGTPLFQKIMKPDGSYAIYHIVTGPPVSDLTDDELDTLMAEIFETFPTIGRRMISGCLKSRGYRVPMARIEASIVRVRGVSGRFGARHLHRRVYNVPGPNSLWHHDGQHGMPSMPLSLFCAFSTGGVPFFRSHSMEDSHTCLHRW